LKEYINEKFYYPKRGIDDINGEVGRFHAKATKMEIVGAIDAELGSKGRKISGFANQVILPCKDYLIKFLWYVNKNHKYFTLGDLNAE
jgi:hypothetical protein